MSDLDRLSPRQREILELLAKGLTNGEIGGVLGISAATVRNHVTAVFSTLDVSNRTEAAALFVTAEAQPERVADVLRGPAVAVLPFAAHDADARVVHIASAVAYDLSALFARSSWLPVIAHAAVVGLRPGQEPAAALGARFLVHGALRVSGPAWRLVVRVDDASAGQCLWTETYDFQSGELFEVQDLICCAIVATASPVMMRRVQATLRLEAAPADVPAWELAHRGLMLVAARDRERNREATVGFRAALDRDPTLVLAHYGLGLCAYDQILNQWTPRDAGHGLLAESAERCVDLAPHAAEGYYLRGRLHQASGDHRSAALALEGAIGRNPSFAAAHALLAQALHLSDRSDEGIVRMKHAERLGPRAFVAGLATLHFARGEYPEAVEAAEAAIASTPRYTFARAIAAASAWLAGEHERAREHVARLRTDYPSFEARGFLRTFGPEVDAVSRLSGALTALGV